MRQILLAAAIAATIASSLWAQGPGTNHPSATTQTCHLVSANPTNPKLFQFVPKNLDLAHLNRFPKVAYLMNEDGSVSNAKILKGTGSAKVDADLIKSILRWKYRAQPGCAFDMSMIVVIDIGGS